MFGALAPPPYPKLSHDRVTSTQRKLEQKYLLFLRVENPKEQEIPHCGGYARPQGLGCLRSNACGLALPACRPPQSKSKKVLDKETNESSLCLFSEAACGLDINSLSISIYFARNQQTPYKRRYKGVYKNLVCLSFYEPTPRGNFQFQVKPPKSECWN